MAASNLHHKRPSHCPHAEYRPEIVPLHFYIEPVRRGHAYALNAVDGLATSLLAYIPLYVNLGVEAEFALTRKFSLWLRGDNLLNMNVQRFPCYSSGGIGATAGIIVNL